MRLKENATTPIIESLNENNEIANYPPLKQPDQIGIINVLHVDDDPCIQETSKAILTMEGNFEIDNASSVEDAFNKMANKQYDAIISDFEMPIKNGLEFLKALREQKNGIPFILFTGKGREAVVIQALNLGADYYVNKQGSPETVYGELSHHLRSAVASYRAKLQNSNDALALHNVQEAVVMLDTTFAITSWNKAAEEMFGLQTCEAMENKIDDICKRIQINPPIEKLMEIFKTKNHFCEEILFLNKNGDRRIGILEIVSIIAENGQFMGVIGSCHDITERKKAEKELFYQANLLSQVHEAVIGLNDTNYINYWNKGAEAILGWTAEETIGKNGTLFLKNRLNGLSYEAIIANLLANGHWEGEAEYIRKDGEQIILDARASTFKDSDGKLLGIVTSIRDVTDRRKAEEDRQKTLNRFYSCLSGLHGSILLVSKDGRVEFANTSYGDYFGLKESPSEVIGFSSEEIIGKIKDSFLYPDQQANRIREIIAAGKPVVGEEVAMKGNRTCMRDFIPLWQDGKSFSRLWHHMDITERKEMEQNLIESEEKYRDIFDNAVDTIYVHDLTGKVTSVNKVVEEYGFKREDFIGKNFLDFIPKEYWTRIKVQLSELARGKRIQGEIEINTPLGKRSAEYRSNPLVRGNKVVAVHSVLRDTTDRKKYEEAILESQQKFSALFTANPEASVFLDTDFHVIEANPQFSKLFGYSFDEVRGKVVTDIIVPEDAKEESKNIRRKVLSEAVEVVTTRKKKDSSHVPLFMSGGPVSIKDKVIGSVMVYKDVSDLIVVQDALSKALAKAELLNEKLSIVGGFVRHDVRNKLNVISGNAYLAKKQAGDNAAIQKYLEQIKQSSDSIVRILDFAKNFELLGNEKLGPVEVGYSFDQAVSLLADLRGVEIVNECTGYIVIADSMLITIFHNLIDNSVKYGGKLTQIKVCSLKNIDGSTKIIYEDDGVGIDAETKKHLFEKGFGKGSGLGLYLIKQAVAVYGWKIEETGLEGQGAKFVMAIPNTS
jgi:PAS domain S-box-containing protein